MGIVWVPLTIFRGSHTLKNHHTFASSTLIPPQRWMPIKQSQLQSRFMLPWKTPGDWWCSGETMAMLTMAMWKTPGDLGGFFSPFPVSIRLGPPSYRSPWLDGDPCDPRSRRDLRGRRPQRFSTGPLKVMGFFKRFSIWSVFKMKCI